MDCTPGADKEHPAAQVTTESYAVVGSPGACTTVAFIEPTASAVALQRHAEVVRPHLHAEFFPEIHADLLGRDIVPERADSTQRGIA
jgi:hypothetical protein